jgi:serine/threonine protein phosphatase PrpC
VITHTRLDVATATDVGMRRQQNEDSHGCWMPESAGERERRGVLLVVADGMGGSLAGEVASRLAVQTVLSTYREADGASPLDALFRALETANQVVHGESTRNPQLSGMGTTCTAVAVIDRDVLLAHVGDSRAYLMRDGRPRQLTKDHSLVAQMVREGQLTPEQAKSDPRRNVVTRSVGVGAAVEIDAQRLDHALEPGDTLLICSDGLHGLLSDDDLASIASQADLAAGCRDLIALANDRGGPDNITVVLARLEANGDGVVQGASASRAWRDPEITQTSPGSTAVHADAETTMVYMAPAARPAPSPSELVEDHAENEDERYERLEVERAARRRFDALNNPEQPPELVASRRPSSTMLVIWLLVALLVLVLALAAMGLVWNRLDRNRAQLEGQDAQQTEGR